MKKLFWDEEYGAFLFGGSKKFFICIKGNVPTKYINCTITQEEEDTKMWKIIYE